MLMGVVEDRDRAIRAVDEAARRASRAPTPASRKAAERSLIRATRHFLKLEQEATRAGHPIHYGGGPA